MEETSKNNETAQLGIGGVSVSLLTEFAEYILHNANWSESYADKPWYSEILDKEINSNELAELFLNSR